MDLGLSNKRALVMGGSQGIGRAIALSLAGEGAAVTVVARDATKLEAVVAELQALGASADLLVIDVSDAQQRATLCQHLAAGRYDILVANAGGPPPGAVPGIAEDVWQSHFDMMVKGMIAVIESALPYMQSAGWGRIAVVSSSGIQIPIPKLAISNTLRSALAAYAKSLAEQVAADGVTVNLLLPGRIDTDRVKSIDAGAAKAADITPAQARTRSIATIPAARYGDPREFGDVAAFICSERASYVTGSQIRIDGGLIRAL